MKEIIFTPPPDEEVQQIRLGDILPKKHHAVITLPKDPINRSISLLMQDQLQPYGGYFWHSFGQNYTTDTKQFYDDVKQAIADRQNYLERNRISCNFYQFDNKLEFLEWAKKWI